MRDRDRNAVRARFVKPRLTGTSPLSLAVNAFVERKLAASMMNHRTAMEGPRKGFDYHKSLRRAATLRLDAELADPKFLARYWAIDERLTPRGYSTHREMMSFYRQIKVA